jgi:hypothetical protein
VAFSPTTFATEPSLSFKGIHVGKSNVEDVLAIFKGAKVTPTSIEASEELHVDAVCGKRPEYDKAIRMTKESIDAWGSKLKQRNECSYQFAVNDQLYRIGKSSRGDYVFRIENGTVISVVADFTSGSLGVIAPALTEKFGKPSSAEPSTVKTRAGTSFENYTFKWLLPEGQIIATMRSGEIDRMALRFDSLRFLSLNRENDAKAAKEAAKNL